eukprot:gnl/TRDRNA2_/TRDRNA2_186090_c0_seq1.p1 gnl/TRDRNA2_/TRDRNA2_186090_c0~~gnl/TRDRNA2_/TRDRNA2_186090_c0_seq1.p1  ORF type:complete len:543 (-),score=88.16 gnl/TRDRNA2_/TRDRNA2_186090_c0_seq1:508-2136(-)
MIRLLADGAALAMVVVVVAATGELLEHEEQQEDNQCLLQGRMKQRTSGEKGLARLTRGRDFKDEGRFNGLGLADEAIGIEGAGEVGPRDGPNPAGWFGDFSESESTFSADGLSARTDQNPERLVEDGFNPALHLDIKPYEPQVKGVEFFHESNSGGSSAAWQTHYPIVDGSPSSHRLRTGDWRETPRGWTQDYVPSDLAGTADVAGHLTDLEAEWFDADVNQYDGYGRKMMPKKNSERSLLGDGWQMKTVNKTISCKESGCEADATVDVFDAKTEEGKLCTVNLHVHPTDYDDDHSREHIELVTLNGFIADTTCSPKLKTCNTTEQERDTFLCLSDYPADQILNKSGSIKVHSKISTMVDECPYNDNMFSGIISVTCAVKQLSTDLEYAQASSVAKTAKKTVSGHASLSCSKPGCVASTFINIDADELDMENKTCKLTINITQTDFDDTDSEVVEFVAIEEKDGSMSNLTTSEKPGKNPCSAKQKGTPLADNEKIFTIVQEHDVTARAQAGSIFISAKLSDMVDECDSDGKLLDGQAYVECT